MEALDDVPRAANTAQSGCRSRRAGVCMTLTDPRDLGLEWLKCIHLTAGRGDPYPLVLHLVRQTLYITSRWQPRQPALPAMASSCARPRAANGYHDALRAIAAALAARVGLRTPLPRRCRMCCSILSGADREHGRHWFAAFEQTLGGEARVKECVDQGRQWPMRGADLGAKALAGP
jgi:hypothetical protein